MSNIVLSNTQQLIERSIFEAIRLELVDKGYLPDITRYSNNTEGRLAYESAIQSIVSTMGFAIELFNESSNTFKGVKKSPRIVINTGNFLPGDLGGDPQRFYVDNGTTFDALVTPPQMVDFYLNIHLVSNTVQQERVLNSILALAVPRRAYIPWYTDKTQFIFCRNINFFNANNPDVGLIEKVYAYEIPDCWDSESRLVEQGVPKITDIALHPNVLKYIEGDWGGTEATQLTIKYSPRGNTMGSASVIGNLYHT